MPCDLPAPSSSETDDRMSMSISCELTCSKMSRERPRMALVSTIQTKGPVPTLRPHIQQGTITSCAVLLPVVLGWSRVSPLALVVVAADRGESFEPTRFRLTQPLGDLGGLGAQSIKQSSRRESREFKSYWRFTRAARWVRAQLA